MEPELFKGSLAFFNSDEEEAAMVASQDIDAPREMTFWKDSLCLDTGHT